MKGWCNYLFTLFSQLWADNREALIQYMNKGIKTAVVDHKVVLDNQINAPKIPPNFSRDFFPTIRKLAKSVRKNIELSTIKSVYNFLIIDLLNIETDRDGAETEERPLKPIRCELAHPDTDWKRLWRLARLKGLGSELTSFILSLLWGILPTRERLHRINPKIHTLTTCALCTKAGRLAQESLLHAVTDCPENKGIPALLLLELRSYVPGLSYNQVLTLDIDIEPDKELPIVWLVGSLIYSIWIQRTVGRVTLAKTRADLEAKCRILREGKIPSVTNASITSAALIDSMFSRAALPINALAPSQR